MKKLLQKVLLASTVVSTLFLASCFSPTDSNSNSDSNQDKDTTIIGGDTTITGGDTTVTGGDTTVTGGDTTITKSIVDSLFTVMLERVQDASDQFEYEDPTIKNITGLEFADLATQFNRYTGDGNIKANVGYIVTELASLNRSESLKQLADSLDVFFSQYNNGKYVLSGNTTSRSRAKNSEIALPIFPQTGVDIAPTKSTLASQAYQKKGVDGLSLTLLAQTPTIIRSQTVSTSFPKFITISHIQNIIDNDVITRVDNVILALERIEKGDQSQSLTFRVPGIDEVVEIDLADIYLLDASMRALRGSLRLFTARNWDVRGPQNQEDYAWFQEVYDLLDKDSTSWVDNTTATYSLKGDTLVERELNELSDNEKDVFNIVYDATKNTLNSNFGTIRSGHSNDHQKAFEDFKNISKKLRKGLDALDAEEDNQENDLIKKVHVNDDLSGEMADLVSEMQKEGLSYNLAKNFKTPRTLLSFVDEILSGPYHFQETIEGQNFDITIDISKYFTNPIQDFKEYLPKYKLLPKNEIFQTMKDTSSYTNSYYGYYGYYGYWYDNTKFETDRYVSNVVLDLNYVNDSIVYNDYGYSYEAPYYHIVTVKDSINYEQQYYDYEIFMPIEFLDDNGNPFSFDEMLEMVTDTTNPTIPYFSDYTFNGIFPGMTRDKWNEQLKNLMNAI